MFIPIAGGRRLLELQKCRSLRFQVTLLRKASAFHESFSYATATDLRSEDDTKGNATIVSYMVDSCGLTTELAESISRKVSFEDSDNPLRVLNLLRSHEFTDSQICTIVKTHPRLLSANAEKSIGPKLEFLRSRGASLSEFREIVSKVPRILGKRGNNSLGLCYDFLKDILIHHEEDGKSSGDEEFSRSLAQGAQKNIVHNISVLRQMGVPRRFLSRMLIRFPGSLYGKERFEGSVKKAVEMGFDPTTSKFADALQVLKEMSDETMQQKVDALKRQGLSESDIWAIFKKRPVFFKNSTDKITRAFEGLRRCGLVEEEIHEVFKKHPVCLRYSEEKIANSLKVLLSLGFTRDEAVLIIKRHPSCIGLSEETVKEKTGFLVEEMGWPHAAVCSAPAVLGYSLKKRTVPRCNVIRALMSKGLIKEAPAMSTVLTSPTDVFLNMYVLKHRNEFPDLINIFTGQRQSDSVHKVRKNSTAKRQNN